MRLVLLLLLFVYSSSAIAAKLIWPDYPDGRLYSIDTDQQTLSYEGSNGEWQLVGKVTMTGVVEADIPPVVRVKSIDIDNKRYRYLLVDCTQQVYRFDRTLRSLVRIDHTYFRGYNCHSITFKRRDTLYTFGGYGFWQTNNI